MFYFLTFLTKSFFAAATAASLLICISAAATANAQKENPAARQQIEKAEAERASARKNGDKDALGKLIANDFVEINRNGKVLGKADMLAEQAVQNLRVDETQIRIYGDTAIVNGRASYVSREGAAVATRFTRVWVRRKGKWLLVSHHGSTINSQ